MLFFSPNPQGHVFQKQEQAQIAFFSFLSAQIAWSIVLKTETSLLL